MSYQTRVIAYRLPGCLRSICGPDCMLPLPLTPTVCSTDHRAGPVISVVSQQRPHRTQLRLSAGDANRLADSICRERALGRHDLPLPRCLCC